MFEANVARIRTHRNNIHRYRSLLRTKLSDLERDFIGTRMADEQVSLDALIAATFPVTFPLPRDSSPIASSGMLFFNTLFDENAASHIALGQAYTSCLRDGEKLTPEELAAKGANTSFIHVDWMIGSNKMDIDGITTSGTAEPLMRRGEWV